MRYSWVKDNFDSEILGFNAAKILSIDAVKSEKVNIKTVQMLVKDLVLNKIKYAVHRAPADNFQLTKALTKSGFILISSIMTLRIDLHNFQNTKPEHIRKVKASDLVSIKKMVKGMYVGSRYYNDSTTFVKADDFYQTWVENSVSKTAASDVLVYNSGILEGFITLKKISEDTYSIPLAGVTKNSRGKGIGKKLVRAALVYCKGKSANSVTIDAEISNTQALSTYISCGFRPYKSFFVYSWKD